MKNELKELIKVNYAKLSESETDGLVEKILTMLPKTAIRLTEVKVGETFKFAGYEFTKLADEEESCYCIMNGMVVESQFGETNDWVESLIRKRLNEFDENGNSKAIKGISKEDLVEVSLNYYAYKVPNGRTDDRITLLSWEEVYMYDFPCIGRGAWLRSGSSNSASGAYDLTSSGGRNYGNVDFSYAVRPALHFRRDIEVEI